MLRRVLKWVGVVVALALLSGGVFVYAEVRAFDRSMAKVYEVPLPRAVASTDKAVLERGEHLARSLGECTACHGSNMGGGREEPLGPLGTIVVPNVTAGRHGRLAAYSDAELARLIKHGIKRDGRSVVMMPSQNTAWWPTEDVAAVISWLRSLPPVDGNPGKVELGAMAKLLDRRDSIPIDIARRIDHAHLPEAPAPAPNASYGSFLATSCRGCHGPALSGGPIPGAAPDLPVPTNLTLHETGLAGFTYEQFSQAIDEGRRKDGKPLDPFMPVESLRNYHDLERRALWAYIESVPPRPFGER